MFCAVEQFQFSWDSFSLNENYKNPFVKSIFRFIGWNGDGFAIQNADYRYKIP